MSLNSILCKKYSLNSSFEKDFNNSFSLINLSFNGFIAEYLQLFILTIFVLLALLLFVDIAFYCFHQIQSMTY